MAWRIEEQVLRGEIDNRTPGRVIGKIWLFGREEARAILPGIRRAQRTLGRRAILDGPLGAECMLIPTRIVKLLLGRIRHKLLAIESINDNVLQDRMNAWVSLYRAAGGDWQKLVLTDTENSATSLKETK